ncbi:MAG: pyridoxamine 5'-phosphate oxidase family protein [Chloroflexi bacterium]|nr:pyridoxamine 5'-phosphate oxidase family protein [Chloroflexota bacterium]
MATWGQFAEGRPDMAEVLLKLLEWIPITYLATVRRDGSPRVHPVCPIIAGGRMFIAVADTSPKRFDLRRDGRYALHGLPGKRDDEFYVTGRAALVEDAATRAQVVEAAGHSVHDSDWVFELRIDRAMTAYWEKVGQPDTYAVRQFWWSAG